MPRFQSILQGGISNNDLNVNRVKTIFPFVKGTDYEMSLESGDELLIIDFKPSHRRENSLEERWSSIDDMPEDMLEAKFLNVTVDPPLTAFSTEIKQFVEFNQNYGDGWVTALKVRIYGNWTTKSCKVILREIGLVPANYIERLLKE